MGVVHSMDDEQVGRISKALSDSANAIQGINNKFDMVDVHYRKMQEHHNKINSKIDDTLQSFARMDDTLQQRTETVLDVITYATDELSLALEGALIALSRFDLRRETTQLPKIIIPLTIPLIVLLIELAVANAYLGILLASLPEVRVKYSRYLLSNASTVLLGLTMSLLWLGIYRLWLSHKTRKLEKLAMRQQEHTTETLRPVGLTPETSGPWRSKGSKVSLGVPPGIAPLLTRGGSGSRATLMDPEIVPTRELEAELKRRSVFGSNVDSTLSDSQHSQHHANYMSQEPSPKYRMSTREGDPHISDVIANINRRSELRRQNSNVGVGEALAGRGRSLSGTDSHQTNSSIRSPVDRSEDPTALTPPMPTSVARQSVRDGTSASTGGSVSNQSRDMRRSARTPSRPSEFVENRTVSWESVGTEHSLRDRAISKDGSDSSECGSPKGKGNSDPFSEARIQRRSQSGSNESLGTQGDGGLDLKLGRRRANTDASTTSTSHKVGLQMALEERAEMRNREAASSQKSRSERAERIRERIAAREARIQSEDAFSYRDEHRGDSLESQVSGESYQDTSPGSGPCGPDSPPRSPVLSPASPPKIAGERRGGMRPNVMSANIFNGMQVEWARPKAEAAAASSATPIQQESNRSASAAEQSLTRTEIDAWSNAASEADFVFTSAASGVEASPPLRPMPPPPDKHTDI